MIISVVNRKGGVGKTTIALHIATELALQGAELFLVDADPQRSSRDWATIRTRPLLFPIVGLAQPKIHLGLANLAMGYDFVIIDAPPGISAHARSAMAAADLILIPVQPSSFDVWACDETVKIAQKLARQKKALRSAFVINRRISKTTVGRDVVTALAAYAPRVLRSTISQRVAFAESIATGCTVLETAPKGAGAEEIRNLVREIQGLYCTPNA